MGHYYSSNQPYRWLILPVETKVRELDGKLLLAAHAAERGWGVIIGHKDMLAEVTAKIKGVVIEKDGYAGNIRIDQYLASGKPVCVLDEEGLVYLNSLDYYRRRLNEENLRKIKYYFLWGEIQKRDVLEHVKGIESKLILTGNPRLDLLRPELRDYYRLEAAAIKQKFGNFILVNTNFADSNHFLGTEWVIQNHRNTGFIKTKKDEQQELSFIQYQSSIVKEFMKMVRHVCTRYPDRTVIVRPHPSENHDAWSKVASDLDNFKVIHEGDVNAWLLAADLSIHNSCMTGIQGFLLDKPVIAYMPVHSEPFDYYLPNALSRQANSLQELFSAIDTYLEDSGPFEDEDNNAKLGIAEMYMTGIHGAVASDRILDALDKLDLESDTYTPYDSPISHPVIRNQKERTSSSLTKRIIRKISGRSTKPEPVVSEAVHDAYSRQKYPGVTLEEMQQRLARLTAATGRFHNIAIKQHSDQAFVILPHQADEPSQDG